MDCKLFVFSLPRQGIILRPAGIKQTKSSQKNMKKTAKNTQKTAKKCVKNSKKMRKKAPEKQ